MFNCCENQDIKGFKIRILLTSWQKWGHCNNLKDLNLPVVSLTELQVGSSGTGCAEGTKEHWPSIPGQWHAKPKPSDHRTGEFLKLNRAKARQVTGLLTEHGHLKAHHFKLGISDIPVYGRRHVVTETAPHILCKRVSLAGLRFCGLGKHFMEPSHYDEIPLYKIRSLEARDY
jgi:hypothetical protein